MSDKNNNNYVGIGFLQALTIAFVVLKLVGVIEWSWFWVLSPVLISIAFVFLIILGYVLLLFGGKKRRK